MQKSLTKLMAALNVATYTLFAHDAVKVKQLTADVCFKTAKYNKVKALYLDTEMTAEWI